MPELPLVRLDHAPALLVFERENRVYFAAAVPDRGAEFFAEFDAQRRHGPGWKWTRPSAISCYVMDTLSGHAFISYVREDSHNVDGLQQRLEAAGILVWRDTADLWPGEDWRAMIRHAITRNALVFVACFSFRSVARKRSYQNEELILAMEQLRLRPPGMTWLIPVRFDDCDIPEIEIGGGRTLASIQRVDLFGDDYDASRATRGGSP